MEKLDQLILLVDEDPQSAAQVRKSIQSQNPSAVVMHFGSAARVLEIVQSSDVSMLITELGFQDGYSGRDLIEDMRRLKKGKDLPILVLTDKDSSEVNREELDALGVHYLRKPIEEAKLSSFVNDNAAGNLERPKGPVKKITLHMNEFLFYEGDQGRNLYILMEGKLSALKKISEDQFVSVGSIIPGQVFGEMAFIEGSRRSVSIRADEKSLIFELESSELQQFLEWQPAWMKILFESLMGRVRNLNHQLAQLKDNFKKS